MSSVQQIAPFVPGPVTLPSTLEVVGAATADSTLEVKGAATLDSTVLVKGASSLDNGLITTTGAGYMQFPQSTVGGIRAGAIDIRNGGAGGFPLTVFTGGSANWGMGWTNVSTGRSVVWPDYGIAAPTTVNPIVSNSSGGQSMAGGLTLDALTLTSTLQFSIGAGALQSIGFTLSTSDLSTLASVGKSLLSAPGAGNLIVPVHFIMEFVFGTQAITGGGGGNIVLCYNATTGNAASAGVADAFVQTSQNQVAVPTMSFNTAAANVLNSSSCVNQALWIRKTNTDYTMNGSTGSIRGRLWYMTHTGL